MLLLPLIPAPNFARQSILELSTVVHPAQRFPAVGESGNACQVQLKVEIPEKNLKTSYLLEFIR
jgi:hypothetical protein